jgi:four helix bundle protein
MSDFKSHKDLDAWKVAMDMVMVVYRLTANFPSEERFCLVTQMRRAANSVPTNIAEGQARGLARACLNFLRIVLGSLAELDTQLEIAFRLHYVSNETRKELDDLITSSRRLVSGLLRSKARRLGIQLTCLLAMLFVGSQVLS